MQDPNQFMDEPAPPPTPSPVIPYKNRAARKLVKGLGLVLVLVILGILALPVCQFFVGFVSSFPEESSSVAQVLDEYLAALANQDAERAYVVVSRSAEAQLNLEILENLVQGNNYRVFEGYQEISFTDFELTQFGSDRSAEVSGYVSYTDNYVGDFSAVLVKENGTWKIQMMQVNVPPDKIGNGN